MSSTAFYIFYVPQIENWQGSGYIFRNLIICYCIHELFATP